MTVSKLRYTPIEFRAWDKKNKRMIEPDNIVKIDFENEEIVIKEDNKYTALKFDDIVLMQYAGVKDAYHQKIYEGDIVEYLKRQRGIVKYTVGSYYIDGVMKITRKDGVLLKRNSLSNFWSDEIKVVGNIYENPELLEGGAEDKVQSNNQGEVI